VHHVQGATKDVTSIQNDSTKPTLDSLELDLERGTLTFHFSEIMKISSLNRDFFKLVGSSLSPLCFRLLLVRLCSDHPLVGRQLN